MIRTAFSRHLVRPLAAVALALATLISLPLPASAQAPAPATPPASVPTPAAAPAPATPTAPPAREEKRVFVPYEDLEKALKDSGQGVFLPYREFLDMWNQLTAQKEKEKEKPPTDALLASAEYTGRVEAEAAVLDAVLKIESFKDGWSTLPLGSGLNIGKAETGEATIRQSDHGPEVILPKKGTYTLKLSLFAKPQRSTGVTRLALRVPKAAVSRLDLKIPEHGWEFSAAEPGVVYSAQSQQDGTTQLGVFFGERDAVTLEWKRAGEESKLTPLLFAETQSHVDLSAGALHTKMDIRYAILRAGVASFELDVPTPHEVLNVTGDNIKEWNVEKAADGHTQTLKVALHAPAKKEFALGLELEAPVESLPATLHIPAVEAKNVVRQRGDVEIRTADELDVEARDALGLAQQAVAAAPAQANQQAAPANATPLLGSWRYLKLPFALALSAKRAEPVVEATSFTNFRVLPDTLTFDARFDLTVKRAGIFDFAFVAPAGWDKLDVTGDAVDTHTDETVGADQEKRRVVTVRFKNRLIGATSFNVTARQLRATPETDASVPVFSPQKTSRHEASIGVQVDETLEAQTKSPGGLQTEDVRRLLEKSGALQTKGMAMNPYTIGFRYRESEKAPEPATLTFKTKKPQVSGEVLALAEVKEQSVSYRWWLQWNIVYSGVDTFVVSLPKDVAGDIRVETKTLKEIDKAYRPAQGAEDSKVYWKIVARDKVLGAFEVELSWEKPLGTLEAGQQVAVEVPELALLDLYQETGQTAVAKMGNLEVLAPEASPTLEPVDPRELAPSLRGAGGLFLAYKWKRHPATLKLPVTKNRMIDVPQAIVTYADVTSVVSTDQSVTTEVIYWVKNNTQQYFTVRLPAGGQMLSDVTVAGASQQPQRRQNGAAPAGKEEGELLIRLPADQQRQGQFPIRFVYDVPAPKAGAGLGNSGAVTVPAPELLDAAVLQSQATLYLPNGYSWHGFDGPMRPPATTRGWTRLRHRFAWLIPALGPQVPELADAKWPAPPALSDQDRGRFSFQIPRDGLLHRLHRLDKPATVGLHYRAKRIDHTLEAAGLLLGLLGALAFAKTSCRTKAGYFFIVGIGALVAEGALDTRFSGFLRYLYLGVALGAGLWLLLGFLKLFRRKPVPLVPPAPPAAPPGPSAPPPDAGPPAPTDPPAPAPAAFSRPEAAPETDVPIIPVIPVPAPPPTAPRPVPPSTIS